MCYNCGCQIPSDDMGKGVLHKSGASLVEEDFEHMANEWNMTVEEVKKNIYEMLKREVGEKEEE